jgi:hypothetical protein
MAKLTQWDAALPALNCAPASGSARAVDSQRQLPKPGPRIDGVVSGRLVGWDCLGRPLVRFGALAGPGIAARSTVALGQGDAGREVVLMFEDGAINGPLILGLIEKPAAQHSEQQAPTLPGRPDKVEVDGKALLLTAETEIVLRCGDASITLTRAGKIIIRGTYVLSRSSGTNRIKGGNVLIN